MPSPLRTYSATILGIDAIPVEIEANIFASQSFEKAGALTIVGLPDTAIRESRERIKSAVYASSLRYPEGAAVINLAPADLKKEGAAFDLSMALCLLASFELFPREILNSSMILGELALDGTVRPVRGTLSAALAARALAEKGTVKRLIIPADNAREGAVVADKMDVFPVASLLETIQVLKGGVLPMAADADGLFGEPNWDDIPDFADVKGQVMAKRALEIAAAGGHNVLFVGPPGTGKSMLAKRLPGILPPMTIEETLEISKIHSILGLLPPGEPLLKMRPFRSPHHTISDAGLLGGGSNPQPGEISLAHNGVLFLDELPEFKRNVLEVMRLPLENGEVCVSRAAGSFTFPAKMILIAAMNPCPCGHLGDRNHRCTCRSLQIQQYRSKISGPLLDRIDLHVDVASLTEDELLSAPTGESSAAIRARVIKARQIQQQRYACENQQIRSNSEMQSAHLQRYCKMTTQMQILLRHAIEKFGLSARAYDRILRVARTIADLAGTEEIRQEHLFEAIGYRSLDRPLH